MTQLITIEQVQEVARRLPENAVNPGGGCYYTVGDEHCVAGQILVELGLPCPGKDEDRPFTRLMVADRFEPAAARLIWRAQYKADRDHTWGEALRAVGLLDPTPSEDVDKL